MAVCPESRSAETSYPSDGQAESAQLTLTMWTRMRRDVWPIHPAEGIGNDIMAQPVVRLARRLEQR